MIKEKTKSKKGFSLIELVVAMGIFTLAVTMATAIFVTINRLNIRGVAMKDAQQNARLALEEISRTVRGSKEVSITPIPPPSVSTQQLTIKTDTTSYVFSVSGNGILQKTEGSLTSNITSDRVLVEELKFAEVAGVPSILNIDIRVTEKESPYEGAPMEPVDLSTSVVLRGQY